MIPFYGVSLMKNEPLLRDGEALALKGSVVLELV